MANQQANPSKPRMRKSVLVFWQVVIGGVLVAATSITTTAINAGAKSPEPDVQPASSPAPETQPKPARELLSVTSPSPSGDPLDAGTLNINLAGKISGQLPSGRQIWGAYRARGDQGDDGGTTGRLFAFTPVCVVDEVNSTFDCGNFDLGARLEPGKFVLHVGLADSHAARELLAASVDQATAKSWDHPIPAGLELADPVFVQRQ